MVRLPFLLQYCWTCHFRVSDIVSFILYATLDTQSRNVPHTARPTSPYVFGDASAHLPDSSNPHTRRQMQTPTSERVNALSSSANASADSHKGKDGSEEMIQVHNGQSGELITAVKTRVALMSVICAFTFLIILAKHSESDEMETDLPEKTSHRKPAIELVTTSANSDPVTFDYNMRRHSLGGEPARPSPVGQSRASPVSPASQAGSKRKMSSDRSALPSVGEEIDPQLIGPGTHSAAPTESDEPAPKRRSSAFDTRIAQLSLYDRRDSIDSRMSGTSTWWGNDRRDSTSSILSNTSLPSGVAGYNPPAFAGDSVRPPGSMTAFAWPPNNGPGDPNAAQASAHGEPVDPNVGRQLDAHIPPHSTAPPSGIPFDRRMSVPDAMPSTTTTRPERLLRSRSRPPSRSTRGVDVSSATTHDTQQLLVSTSADDSPSSSSPTATTSQTPQKESGATPYSRSPELRVSHKLAERKRRKEMRDLFDELRDQLPADRGMKASKWEILSKGSSCYI